MDFTVVDECGTDPPEQRTVLRAVRLLEVGVVGSIERFAPELQAKLLLDCEDAGDCRVQRYHIWPNQYVSAGVPKSASGRQGETRRIHPLGNRLRTVIGIATRNCVGPIRILTGQADIPALVGSKRAARLKLENARHLPATGNFVQERLAALAEGQCPNRADHQTMAHVEVGKPALA